MDKDGMAIVYAAMSDIRGRVAQVYGLVQQFEQQESAENKLEKEVLLLVKETAKILADATTSFGNKTADLLQAIESSRKVREDQMAAMAESVAEVARNVDLLEKL